MRGSRIFAGIVIIALIAIALIYLEDHGYFKNARVAPLGVMKSDETAPKPEPPEADQTVPVATTTTTTAQDATKPSPANATTNEAVATAPQAAATQPMTPANSHTQYVDAQGNVCRPMQVPNQVKAVETTPRPRRRRNVADDGWSYAPRAASRMSTPCGMIRQTTTGERVVNLQSGMVINVALDHELSTGGPEPVAAGQEFSGFLIGPITYCGEVIVPAGAQVEGTVVGSRRHTLTQEDDATLQLRMTVLDANGYRVPLVAYSYNRRMYGEVPYKTVNYMNDPNFVTTTHTSNHDVTLPAHSVVSFYLQAPAPVYF